MCTNLSLSNAKITKFLAIQETLDEASHTAALHEAYLEAKENTFIGRSKLVSDVVSKLRSKPAILMVAGKAGTGKSSLLVCHPFSNIHR